MQLMGDLDRTLILRIPTSVSLPGAAPPGNTLRAGASREHLWKSALGLPGTLPATGGSVALPGTLLEQGAHSLDTLNRNCGFLVGLTKNVGN
jgi:hypothetical protein